MSETVRIDLSRADAVALRELFDPRLSWTKIDHHLDLIRALRASLDAALAAAPDAPGSYVGRDAFGQQVIVPGNVTFGQAAGAGEETR